MTAPFLHAQAQTGAVAGHEVDLAVTYTAERSNLVSTPVFWREQGGAFSLSAEFFHGLGAGMNIAGSRVTNINGTGINLSTVTTTFGPTYTWSPASRKYAIFGEGLIGESHGFDGLFPSSSGALRSFDTFALQVGGGVDLRLGRRFAIRPVQADWVRTQFPNASTNIQNSLRLGGGVVLRLGTGSRK